MNVVSQGILKKAKYSFLIDWYKLHIGNIKPRHFFPVEVKELLFLTHYISKY